MKHWTDEHEIGRLTEQRDQLRSKNEKLRAVVERIASVEMLTARPRDEDAVMISCRAVREAKEALGWPIISKIIEGQIDEIEGLRSEADKWRQVAEAAEVTNRGLWQDIETLRAQHAELLRFAGRGTNDA